VRYAILPRNDTRYNIRIKFYTFLTPKRKRIRIFEFCWCSKGDGDVDGNLSARYKFSVKFLCARLKYQWIYWESGKTNIS